MGFLSGIAGAAGSIIGGPVGNALSGWSANQQRKDAADKQMDFQERMSSTAHQREVKDLIAAGLNPMLSARLGGASSPAGAMAPIENVGESSARTSQANTQSAANTAQVENIHQNTAFQAAQTDLSRANEAEVRARTGTHPVSIDQMNQNIEESKTRMQNILQQVKTGAATETNLQQQTKNLQEVIPQIRATIDSIRAQIKLTGAQTTLAGDHSAQAQAQTGLIREQEKQQGQVVQANLPKLEAALRNLERVQKEMQMPGRQNMESIKDGIMGPLLEAIEAMNPLKGIR